MAGRGRRERRAIERCLTCGSRLPRAAPSARLPSGVMRTASAGKSPVTTALAATINGRFSAQGDRHIQHKIAGGGKHLRRSAGSCERRDQRLRVEPRSAAGPGALWRVQGVMNGLSHDLAVHPPHRRLHPKTPHDAVLGIAHRSGRFPHRGEAPGQEAAGGRLHQALRSYRIRTATRSARS